MKLCTHLLAASLALLALGCGEAGPGPAPVPTDAVASTDTGGDAIATADTTPDTTATDTGAPGDTGGGNACCAAKGAECGFVAGCTTSCGACKSGFKCKANKCEEEVIVPKKQFGEACGPDKTCRPPAGGASDAEYTAYFDCLNAQCDSGRCSYGVCLKPCTIAKDEKINGTGAAGKDGIEDPGEPSECDDAVAGPAGNAFRCAEVASPASGQSLQLCMPGTTFKTCKANTDCPTGEACGYKYIYGNYTLVCAPKYTNPGGKPALTTSQICNNDPIVDDLALCENNACLGGSCIGFCQNNSDCVTSPGACEGGKCKGSGATCASDADCSAFECNLNVKFFGENGPGVGVCRGKKCELNQDCGDQDFYCRTFWNGVKNAEGDPDPIDKTSVVLPGWEPQCFRKAKNTSASGEACDAFPNDTNTSVPMCHNPLACVSGTCGNLCKGDTDCGSDQKCSTLEYPFDTSDPPDDIDEYVLPLNMCAPMEKADGACGSKKDCEGKTSSYCRLLKHTVSLPGETTATTVSLVTIDGQCVAPNPAQKDFGEACGSAAGALCKSGLCLGATAQNPGYCAEGCDSKASCPETVTIGTNTYKTHCQAVLGGWSGTLADPYDDPYYPLCMPVSKEASVSDCSSTKKCTATGEVCFPSIIASGADKAAKVEYFCRLVVAPGKPVPTKAPGAPCNPNPPEDSDPECASGLCLDDAGTGKGYCSALCTSNADCGTADGMICDVDHMWVPRKDKAKAALVPLCKKKKSCVPCNFDFQCTADYKCTNLGSGTTADGRCAPPCTTDADCGKTDGGAKCVAAKNAKGQDIPGVKVCAPTADACK